MPIKLYEALAEARVTPSSNLTLREAVNSAFASASTRSSEPSRWPAFEDLPQPEGASIAIVHVEVSVVLVPIDSKEA